MWTHQENLPWEEAASPWLIFCFHLLTETTWRLSLPLGHISSTHPLPGATHTCPQFQRWVLSSLRQCCSLCSTTVIGLRSGCRSWEDPPRKKSGNSVQGLCREMAPLSPKLLYRTGTWEWSQETDVQSPKHRQESKQGPDQNVPGAHFTSCSCQSLHCHYPVWTGSSVSRNSAHPTWWSILNDSLKGWAEM